MTDRYMEVNRGTLGTAFDGSTGASYRVVYTKHAAVIPGFEDETAFAVEETVNGQVVRAWGFTNPQDCFKFLTDDGETEYQVPDMRGTMYGDKRQGIGLPDAAVKVYKEAGKYNAGIQGNQPTPIVEANNSQSVSSGTPVDSTNTDTTPFDNHPEPTDK